MMSPPPSRPAAGPSPFRIRRPVWGMTCGACAADIRQALSAVPGVQAVQINPASQWVDISGARAGSEESLEASFQAALAPLGCRLLDDSPDSQRQASQRSLRMSLFRLLLAALVWMQIMMYAWPEYSHSAPVAEAGVLHLPDALTAQDRTLLRWAQWMLSLPLMLFCARPLLQAAWRGLRRGRPGLDVPAVFALIAAWGVSSEATFSGGGPVWFDSLSMFVLFLLFARHLAERLRHQALMTVLSTRPDLPEQVERRLAEGGWQWVTPAGLAAGDVVRIAQGDAFPADGTLTDGPVNVSEALITGENSPVLRRVGDTVLAGSRLLEGTATFRVTASGDSSLLGQIAAQITQVVGDKPQGLSWVDRAAMPLLLALVLVSALSGAWAEWQTPGNGWPVALAVLMVSCPCAILIAAPAAWVSAALRLRAGGILLREASLLERLRSISDVVFDKTGTLTEGERVSSVRWMGVGTGGEAALRERLCGMAAASRHPLSRAIAAWGGEAATVLDGVHEEPGQGLEWIHADGARYRLGHAGWCGVARYLKPEGAYMSPDRHEQAHVWFSCQPSGATHWTPLCDISIETRLRAGALRLVRSLKHAGLRVHVWSGDAHAAVQAVAARIGADAVQARMTPQEKWAALQNLQAGGASVLMVGDGLNDALVMAAADASVAMGEGSRLTQMQADAVLVGAGLSSLSTLLKLSGDLQRIICQNLGWALAYNVICIPLAATGFFSPLSAGVGMAVSSAWVVLNAMRLQRSRFSEDNRYGSSDEPLYTDEHVFLKEVSHGPVSRSVSPLAAPASSH